VIQIRPAFPVHSLVKVVGSDVVVIAIGLHDLPWGSCRLSKFCLIFLEPARFDGRAFVSGDVLGISIDVEGDCQHIAVNGVVPNPLACIALYARFVCAATLVRPCEPTLGFVGRWARGAKTVSSVCAAVIPVGMVASIPIALKMIYPWAVALEVTEGCFVILRSVPRGNHAHHTVNPRGV
jgi:hypothetical protein